MDRRTSQRTFGLESDETNDYNKNNNAEDMLTKTNTGRKAASKQLDTSNIARRCSGADERKRV